jgi:hypothetical protein
MVHVPCCVHCILFCYFGDKVGNALAAIALVLHVWQPTGLLAVVKALDLQCGWYALSYAHGGAEAWLSAAAVLSMDSNTHAQLAAYDVCVHARA